MTQEEYTLTCLAEECMEVSQRVTKALRFGLDDVQAGQNLANAARISHEFAHILALWERVVTSGMVPAVVYEDISRKRDQFKEYLEYAKRKGVVV